MAKNRKNRSVAIRFGPAIKALLVCSLFVVSGVGYVWQKSLIVDLRQLITTREADLKKLRQQNEKLSDGLAKLKSPEELNRRLTGLGLAVPKPVQVLWLIEPAELPPAHQPPAVQRYAARP